jgi:hypothetical protein
MRVLPACLPPPFIVQASIVPNKPFLSRERKLEALSTASLSSLSLGERGSRPVISVFEERHYGAPRSSAAIARRDRSPRSSAGMARRCVCVEYLIGMRALQKKRNHKEIRETRGLDLGKW